MSELITVEVAYALPQRQSLLTVTVAPQSTVQQVIEQSGVLQQFPDIAPPAVQVVALYPGANAETVLRSVAPSLEEAINGVENMSYMSSTASNDGSLVITVNFKLGTNPDQAAVNVQNRVSQATSQLPQEVVQAGISTTKQQNSLLMVVDLLSENEKEYDQTFLANYAQINIIPDLKRIPGVGQALIFGGSKDYSLRVWLNPAKMANYNLTPKEVMDGSGGWPGEEPTKQCRRQSGCFFVSTHNSHLPFRLRQT